MEIKVNQIEGVRFSIEARNHTVVCDQPADYGGQDTGMTPPEFLLGALGSCAAYYALQYLKTRELATSGVQVSVSAEKLKAPARLGNFRIHLTCPVPLTEEHQQGLTRAVHACLIHNTLLSSPAIELALDLPVAAQPA